MRTRTRSRTAVIALALLSAVPARAQLMSRCVEKPPVARGQFGCSIVETKPLPVGVRGPVFWHIDHFDSLTAARAAVDETSIAFEDMGGAWLMTLESQADNHHGGRHVARVGPLPLPAAARYSMLLQTAVFGPGMYSLPHHHSGVEAVYVVEGEACYETPARAATLRRGETLAMPASTPMRAVVRGRSPRHVLAMIVYDSAQPATTAMDEGSASKLVACK